MEISLSSYSLYHYMRLYKKDIFDAVDKAHEMGFPAMEFIRFPPLAHKNPRLFSLRVASKRNLVDKCFIRNSY